MHPALIPFMEPSEMIELQVESEPNPYCPHGLAMWRSCADCKRDLPPHTCFECSNICDCNNLETCQMCKPCHAAKTHISTFHMEQILSEYYRGVIDVRGLDEVVD